MGIKKILLNGAKGIYNKLDNSQTYTKPINFITEALDNDINMIHQGAKKLGNIMYKDIDKTADKWKGSNKFSMQYITGKELTGQGKALLYGTAGMITAYGVIDGFNKGEQRIRMGDIDADREGLPNKVTANASPIEMNDEAIEQTIKNAPGRVKDLGADGELGLALHKLYGTGQQKFI